MDRTETSLRQRFEQLIVRPALSFVSKRSVSRRRTSALLVRSFSRDYMSRGRRLVELQSQKRESTKQVPG